MGTGGIDDQIVEGDDSDVTGLAGQRLRQGKADQLGSLVERKQRRLAGMDADRDDHLFGAVQGLDQNIHMSIGDRVEGPGIKSCRHLARPLV